MKTLKVIVAGGREFSNYNLLQQKCDHYLSNKVKEGYNIVIVSGTARGADSLGERYAKERGYKISRHPADWNTYGRRAGYLRNAEMANVADALIAFWDGKSPGTKSMIKLAEDKGLMVRVVNY